MTTMHDAVLRHNSSHSHRLRKAPSWLARRFYALRALTEIPAGRRYRAQFGIKALTSDDFAAMLADPKCPVHKRPNRFV